MQPLVKLAIRVANLATTLESALRRAKVKASLVKVATKAKVKVTTVAIKVLVVTALKAMARRASVRRVIVKVNPKALQALASHAVNLDTSRGTVPTVRVLEPWETIRADSGACVVSVNPRRRM